MLYVFHVLCVLFMLCVLEVLGGVGTPGPPGVRGVGAGRCHVGVAEGAGADDGDGGGVHAGQREQGGLGVVPVDTGVKPYRAVGQGGGEGGQGFAGCGLREGGRLGEEMGEAAGRGVQCLAVPPHQPLGLRRTDQCPYGEFLRVGGTRRAQAGAGGDERGEPGVLAEPFVDGVRVGVEVEEPS